MSDVLNVTLSKEEIDAVDMISIKKAQAQAMLDRSEFPKDMESNLIAAFYKGAGDMLSEVQFAEKTWWSAIATKYNLQGIPLAVDTITGKLSKVEIPEE